jgi:hypothetical protein
MTEGFFSRGFRGRRRSQDTALPPDSTWWTTTTTRTLGASSATGATKAVAVQLRRTLWRLAEVIWRWQPRVDGGRSGSEAGGL